MIFKIPPEFNLNNLGQVAQGKLPEGLRGNMATINLMKQVALSRKGMPVVHKMAVNILNFYNTDSQCYADEALAIGDYVKNKVRYVRDPDLIEYLQAPEDIIGAMRTGEARGDCDDMALLIASLLLSIGHKPLFCAVRYDGFSGNYNHIYVVDYEKNKSGPVMRICLDAIVKSQPIGYEVKHASGDEYPIE